MKIEEYDILIYKKGLVDDLDINPLFRVAILQSQVGSLVRTITHRMRYAEKEKRVPSSAYLGEIKKECASIFGQLMTFMINELLNINDVMDMALDEVFEYKKRDK